MSEFSGVGIALDLDGPLPVAPKHGLLTIPGVVKARDATRVLGGANVWGYPEGCAYLWEPCLDGTFRVKNEESEVSTPRFDSYVVYKPLMCSSIGLSNPGELNERISTVLDAILSAGVEEAVAAGVNSSSNPFIGDTNVADLTPTPGTAVSPGVGLSILENAIGGTCRAGMIGATPATIAALQAFPVGGEADNQLETANGTPVYSADGLIGLTTDDLAAPTGTEDWMVAHGPVEVYMGPTLTFDTRSSLERETNTLVFRAERYVLSIWDTALQAAVLVDWAT
jgi:hypothetical protein